MVEERRGDGQLLMRDSRANQMSLRRQIVIETNVCYVIMRLSFIPTVPFEAVAFTLFGSMEAQMHSLPGKYTATSSITMYWDTQLASSVQLVTLHNV